MNLNSFSSFLWPQSIKNTDFLGSSHVVQQVKDLGLPHVVGMAKKKKQEPSKQSQSHPNIQTRSSFQGGAILSPMHHYPSSVFPARLICSEDM